MQTEAAAWCKTLPHAGNAFPGDCRAQNVPVCLETRPRRGGAGCPHQDGRCERQHTVLSERPAGVMASFETLLRGVGRTPAAR